MNTYEHTAHHDTIITKDQGLLIAHQHLSIVHGERGAYVEIDEGDIVLENLYIPDDLQWRITHGMCYYIEYRIKGERKPKVYKQKREIDYAEYRPGFFYISPIYLQDFEVVGTY